MTLVIKYNREHIIWTQWDKYQIYKVYYNSPFHYKQYRLFYTTKINVCIYVETGL